MSRDSEGFSSIDLSDLAPDPFLESVERLRRIYRDMGTALGVDRQMCSDERENSHEKGRDAYEEWEHWIFDDWEEDLEECERFRWEFAIVFLAKAVRELMHEVKSELELPSAKQLHRKGKLRKGRNDAFSEQCSTALRECGVDVTSRREWARIKDLVSARDTIMHPKKWPTSQSSNSQRRIDPSGGGLDTPLDDLRHFCEWLRAEVKAHRSGGAR